MTALTTEKPFDLSTHNGYVTIKSLRTGEHRTIRVRRMKDAAKFAPGKRIAELLTGPDNENDYQSFGFVEVDGSILLWKKHRDSKFYQWLAKCLHHPENWTEQCEFNFDARCRRCNRLLTDPTSCFLGIGPECREREMGMAG